MCRTNKSPTQLQKHFVSHRWLFLSLALFVFVGNLAFAFFFFFFSFFFLLPPPIAVVLCLKVKVSYYVTKLDKKEWKIESSVLWAPHSLIVQCSIPLSSGGAWNWLEGGKFYIWYMHLHTLCEYIIFKTNLKFNVIIKNKNKNSTKKKMLIHNIVFIYWDISHMNDLFLIFFRAKTQVMNETISS